jgi:nicotinamidase/pyrazinamidase
MPAVIFWDVDTQRDFMEPSGKLFVPGAPEIEGTLARLTALARRRGIPLVAPVDDHRLEDPEIALKNPDFRETFPPHCLRGTPGQEKVAVTRPLSPLSVENRPYPPGELEDRLRAHSGEIVIHKQRFDVFTNPNAERVLAWLDPRHVVVYGVAHDSCDRFAVEGLLQRGRAVHLVRDAVRATRPEEGERLLAEWDRLGVGLPLTADLDEGGYLDWLG